MPEIEAIATDTLAEPEQEGYSHPDRPRYQLTMNREGIRRLAAEELGLATSPYRFAGTLEEFRQAVTERSALRGQTDHIIRQGPEHPA